MKKLNIRRMVSAALAVVLVMSLTVGAFAAEDGTGDIPEDGIEAIPEGGTEVIPEEGMEGAQEEETEGTPEGETEATPEVTPEEGTGATPEEGTPEAGTETAPADTGLADETAPAETTEDDMTADVLTFSDVLEDHGFYTAIMDCAAKGITSGYTDGTFRPTNPVTRAQFCVMLSRAFYPQQIGWFPNTDGDGQPWFAPNVKVLSSNGLLKDTSFINNRLNTGIMNQAISRYDMAQLMTNIMAKKGFSATSAQKTEAQKKISDYKSIPNQYQNAVKNVYALGIITGYSNGTFSGNNVMNRGQGCVVIYRMTKYTPAATTTPDVDDSGKPTGNTSNTGTSTGSTGNTGNTGGTSNSSGNTGSSTTGTTTKNVTEAEALTAIKELLKKYPDGSTWASATIRPGSPSTSIQNVYRNYTWNGSALSAYGGCSGFASLVSDTIFGAGTANPARNITLEAVRPGDIIIIMNPTVGGKEVGHVEIAASRITSADDYHYYLNVYSGNTNSKISYKESTIPKDKKANFIVWTRYTTNNSTPWTNTNTGPTGTSSGNTGTNSGSTATTTPNTQPSIQDLMAAPCGLCGKTGGGSVLNDAMTKKVCTNCHNHNRAAAIAYLNS